MAEERRFCENCGTKMGVAAKFCPTCGQPQVATAVLPEQPVPLREGPEETLWEGHSKDLLNLISGGALVSARYRLTNRSLYFDEGLVTTVRQQVPLWAVRDIDVRQGMLQKMRDVSDAVVTVEHSDYTGRNTVILKNVEGALEVRNLLNRGAQRERLAYQQRQQTRYFGR